MTFNRLAILNLAGKKGRSAALFLFALLLSATTFAAALVLSSLRRGLESLELRLGADIIVTPETAYVKKGIENILLYGNRTYFYMPKKRLDEVLSVEGVDRASPQMFLATLSSGCCSVGLQIIGFDPETDFTVRPWLTKAFKGSLGKGDIIVGSKISIPESRTLKFYGESCRIVAQLGETGTGLDNAVYTTLETIKHLIEASVRLGFNDKLVGNPDKSISSVMVKLKDGYDVTDVARQIDRKVKQVKAVKTKSMTSEISNNIASISKIVGVLIAIIWLLCLAVMLVVSTLITGERKKEFAVLRTAGASQKKLSRLILSEALIVNTAGALAGIMLVSLAVFPFRTAIEGAVNLPFLTPSIPACLLLVLLSLLTTVVAGSLTSAGSALKIARLDTGMILREGN